MDERDQPGMSPDHVDRDVARRLEALGREPVPEATRERHLATIQGARRGTAGVFVARPQRGRVRRRLAPVLAAVVAMLLAGGGTVAVAQDAAPDDALYGVKRASEDVWVAVPRGPQRAAEAQLALAMRRHGEAARAPEHAERLLAAGAENAENAADELPEEAFETFKRLLGESEDALPAQASPRARMALHRNCVRLAERHGFAAGECPDAPDVDHPGRRGLERSGSEGPRGFGPGGRPEGETGRPDSVPGRDGGPDGERGFGPDGRPDGESGPPGWSRGGERSGRPDHAGPGGPDESEPEDGS